MNSYGDGNTYRGTVCKDSEVPTIITDGKIAYSGKDYPVHTNGPWARDNFALSIDITSRKGIVATVRSQNCDCPEEIRANARLIAAAPEMLEVLRWLDAEMDCRDDCFGAVLFSRGDFERVRRAINLVMNGDINETDR